MISHDQNLPRLTIANPLVSQVGLVICNLFVCLAASAVDAAEISHLPLAQPPIELFPVDHCHIDQVRCLFSGGWEQLLPLSWEIYERLPLRRSEGEEMPGMYILSQVCITHHYLLKSCGRKCQCISHQQLISTIVSWLWVTQKWVDAHPNKVE